MEKIIEGLSATPSLNKLNGRWSKSNWKKKYIRELRGYELICGVARNKRRVKILRYGTRILDIDNWHGGCKPLIDALKEKKIIIDDNAKWCELVFVGQLKCCRGREQTVMTIEEV
jgi:hypothetical protein